ncbi:MAG TPA: carbohydrate porin, partial [Arachidicoccus sp.]
MKFLKASLLPVFVIILCASAQAQDSDTAKEQVFNIHGQATVISQFKSKFSTKYSGANSLSDTSENATSITASLFMTARLWKNATLSFDTEIAGGKGISQVLGIAEPTNGETFRIGSPEPKVYIARLYFNQTIPLTKDREWQDDDVNQLHAKVPTKYLSFVVGKISMEDYFDNNAYAHDPRDQFMNWNLMAAGAWDYPANTRGYAPSIVLQYISKNDALRYGFSLIPKEANGSSMNWKIAHSHSETIEYDHSYQIDHKVGTFRVLGFLTNGMMGDYNEALQSLPDTPNIISTRQYGRIKYGFALNAEQSLSNDFGVFARGSWNDG